MYCRTCGNKMNDNAEICVKCGVKRNVGNAYCQICGAHTDETMTFCSECGSKLIRGFSSEEMKKTVISKGKYAASIILILIGMLFFVGVLINGIRLLNKPYMSEFYVQPLIICVVCSVIFCGIGGFIKKI